MKKSIPFLMGFILLLGLFTSCDNDDLEGLGKGANGSFSGDKLALTYSGIPMQGKQATFYTSDGKKQQSAWQDCWIYQLFSLLLVFLQLQ